MSLLPDAAWDSAANEWSRWQRSGLDWIRLEIVDPAMESLLPGAGSASVLDVGCGEGRYCRKLSSRYRTVVGVDVSSRLLMAARKEDPFGIYVQANAEAIPFPADSFDTVIAYGSLVSIEHAALAIREMARVLARDGVLLAANLSSFVTACGMAGWCADAAGARVHYPLDNYLCASGHTLAVGNARVRQWHRPLHYYMGAYLSAGLVLEKFMEPSPPATSSSRERQYARVPYFNVMSWRKP